MKRAVLCVPNPQDYIDQLDDYSIMIVNPDYTPARKKYLLDQSDWSLLIEPNHQQQRSGGDYSNERLLWYTSGTVGDSKFYSFTQQQLDNLVKSIQQDLEITANDRYVGVMSLWHAHGQSLYWATRDAGCETHFLSVRQVRQMVDYQPTFVSAIPDILSVINELPLTVLRLIRSGSAPLSPELYQALQHKFQVPVVEYFGMTEAMSHVLCNPLSGPQRPGTVGIPTTGVEADIRDGYLWIKSSNAYTQDWFDTGDLAEQDQYGYYKILGRGVDRINVRGYKLDPVSIEQQMRKAIPELQEIVIFGNSTVNCAYVGDVDVSRVEQGLQLIHSVCYPTWITQLKSIPRSDSGKLSRKWLIKHFNCK
jgi:acyl-CoA synthetase (AMP-forming)/AMP-acid ligase II